MRSSFLLVCVQQGVRADKKSGGISPAAYSLIGCAMTTVAFLANSEWGGLVGELDSCRIDGASKLGVFHRKRSVFQTSVVNGFQSAFVSLTGGCAELS